MNPHDLRLITGVLILFLAMLAVPVAAELADTPWPKYAYDCKNTGQSPYVGPQADTSIKWTFTSGCSKAPAIGTDGTLYIGGNGAFYAVDPNGTEIWHQSVSGKVYSTPAIGSDGTIFFGTKSGQVYALNPDGTVKWSGNLGDEYRGSPAIGPDGTVYFAAYKKGKLCAYDPENGTLKWSTTTSGYYGTTDYSSPAIGTDGTIYLGNGDKRLYAFNPNGTLKWSSNQTSYSIWNSPAIGPDGTIYVVNYYNSVYAFSPDGTMKWTNKTGGGDVYCGPVISRDGTIYIGSSNKNLYALNPDSTLKWTYTAGGKIQSCLTLGADGTIYFLDDGDWKVYAVNPNGTLKWTYAIGGYNLFKSVAIGPDGTLYIGATNGGLRAFTGPLNITADQTIGAAPLAVQFTGTCNSSVLTPTSWSWEFGDGTNSTGQNPIHTYTSPGSYTVRLNITDSAGTNYSVVKTAYIKVYTTPKAAFTSDVTSGMASLTVNFTDTSANNPTSWLWDFGDGANSTEQNPVHIYPMVGTYNINLTATNVAGTNSILKTGYINVTMPNLPVALFTSNVTSGTIPLTVTFTDLSTKSPTSWLWDFGDGTNSTEQNPDHTYAAAGIYTVNLTASNDRGSNTTSMAGYITVSPIVSFTGSPRIGASAPLTVKFNDTSTLNAASTLPPKSWLWEFGDGTNSTKQNPEHTYTSAGTYTVNLTITSAAGSSIVSKPGYITFVTPGPIAYNGAPIYVANDKGIKHDIKGTNPNHIPNTYDFSSTKVGGGLNAMGIHQGRKSGLVPTTNQSGTFEVRFYGGQDTMHNGVLMLAVNETIPDDFSVHIRASGDNWALGEPGNSNLDAPTEYNYVEGVVNETFTKDDFIYGPQIWKPCSISNYPLYYGQNMRDTGNTFRMMFIDLYSGITWNESAGRNAHEITVEYSFNNLTSFAAFNAYGWYVSGNHGTGIGKTNDLTRPTHASSSMVIGIPGAPVANFTSGTDSADIISEVQFTDTSANVPQSWLWEFGDGNTSTKQNPTHTYTTPGTYTVTLSVTNIKGTDKGVKTDYINKIVPSAPVAGFTANATSVTCPHPIQFTDQSTGTIVSRLWNFGDGTNSIEQNPIHWYAPGVYSVNLTVTNSGGSGAEVKTDYITATDSGGSGADIPAAQFTSDITSGEAPLAVQFTDTSTNSPTSWLWEFGDGTNSTGQSPAHTYTDAGTYTVNLTATNTAGSNTASKVGYIAVESSSAGGVLPRHTNIHVRPSNHDGVRWDYNRNSTYYINENGGGLNAVHISTDPTVNAGQVTVSPDQAGTFYVTDTGGRGYQDEIVLMLAVNGTMPDDFSVRIKTSGYTWTPSTTMATPPQEGAYTHQPTALSETFTRDDFIYGPQSWKPSGSDVPYPILYGEDMDSDVNQFRLAFIDTRAGVLGSKTANSATLMDKGAVKIEYTFNNLSGHAVFNAYAWNNFTSKGQGMGWTNRLTGDRSSGYSVIPSTGLVAPVAIFNGTPTHGTAPLTVSFNDLSTGSPNSWAWDFDNDTVIDSTEQNPEHTYTTAGTYNVSLTVTNEAGTDTEVKADYIAVSSGSSGGDEPVAEFTAAPLTGDTPLSVQFTDTSLNNPVSWAWDFDNDGTIDSTEQNSEYTYTTAGTYNVSLTVTNEAGTNTEVKADYIAVRNASSGGDEQVAGFTAAPLTGETPLSVQFTDTSSNNPVSWAWDFDNDGNIDSTEQNPEYIYNDAGTYNVNLTVTNETGTYTEVKTDYIAVRNASSGGEAPVAEFTATPESGEKPLTVWFNDRSSNNPTSWAWDFDNDGTIDSTEQNPEYIYNDAGTYTVNLTVTNEAGTDTEVKTDYIAVSSGSSGSDKPVAEFTANPVNGEIPLTVQFTDTSSNNPTSWAWDFDNDGTIDSTEQNPEYTYNDADIYTVNLTVTNEAGTDTEVKTDYIEVSSDSSGGDAPVAEFTANPVNGEIPLRVQFTDTSSNNPAAWAWDFDNDGTIDSTEQNPVYTYQTPGKYSVNLTVTSDGGTDNLLKNNYICVSGTLNKTKDVSIQTNGTSTDQGNGKKQYSINQSEGQIDGNNIIIENEGYTLTIKSDEAPSTSGGNLVSNVTGIELATEPVETIFDKIGNVSGSLNISLNSIPENSSLRITLEKGFSGQGTAFQIAANASGLDVNNVAYTMNIVKANLINGQEIKEARIRMTVPVAWVNANGGISAIKIIRIAEDGTKEVLETTCIGTSGNLMTFEGYSPKGLSMFGLASVTGQQTDQYESSSQGSSSGGGISKLGVDAAKKIPAGESGTLSFDKTPITEIKIYADKEIQEILITTESGEKPDGSDASRLAGEIYDYIRVIVYKAPENSIEKATIRFNVPKNWVDSKLSSPDTLSLYLYNKENTKWILLSTVYDSEENGYYSYFADTASFGIFAVSALADLSGGSDSVPEPPENPVGQVTSPSAPETTAPTTSASKTSANALPLFGGGMIVFVITAIICIIAFANRRFRRL